MKLMIGSAQLIEGYGIDKSSLGINEFKLILNSASKLGVDALDTSINYKGVNYLLSKANISRTKFDIFTKFFFDPNKSDDLDYKTNIKNELVKSLGLLGLRQYKCVFIHNQEALRLSAAIELLKELKSEGICSHIGVSTYDLEYSHLAIKLKLDYVQIPFSILNQSHKSFIETHGSGIGIIIRSVFVQGLLFQPPEKAEFLVKNSYSLLNQIHSFSINSNISIAKLSIDAVRSLPNIEYILIGFNSLENFEEVNNILTKTEINYSVIEFIKRYSETDSKIYDPRKWILK
jgi:aryl-alcohol dehydrogenase-like predicted oxidoreductase